MSNEKLLQFAKDMAISAGVIQRDNYEKEGLDIQHKGRIDLVTEVDLACEKLMVEAINKEYPEHGILAEEGTSQNIDAEYLWIIDPLDGTTNYAHGFPMFCVSIGLHKNGEALLGVVYDPLRDELFSATAGGGAFMNDKPIKVATAESLEQAMLATGFPYDVKTSSRNNVDNFNRVVVECRAVRRPGSAAMDLVYVACGRVDGFWEQRLFAWDMAAGELIVREAGGKVTNMKNEKLDHYGETICAANQTIHSQLIKLLKD